jgi:carboxylesterase
MTRNIPQPERHYPRDPETGVIRGAEPFEFGNGSHAVLFLHGWTSSPRELRHVAQRVAAAGFFCKGILLPGHGTTLRDLLPTDFDDYLAAAEAAYDALAGDYARVSLCGLSLGGLLCLHLAARRPAANLVLYAPFLIPGGATAGLPNRWALPLIGPWLPPDRLLPKYGEGPIFDPEALAEHIAYHAMPMRGVLSNFRGARRLWLLAPHITNPLILFQSPRDPTSHISGARRLMRRVGSRDKKLVIAERSKHVITLDYDRERIEEETVRWLGARA